MKKDKKKKVESLATPAPAEKPKEMLAKGKYYEELFKRGEK